MKCPACGANNDKVTDSRYKEEENVVYRRRKCISCGCKFTTYEFQFNLAQAKQIREEIAALREKAKMKEEAFKIFDLLRFPS